MSPQGNTKNNIKDGKTTSKPQLKALNITKKPSNVQMALKERIGRIFYRRKSQYWAN